MDLTVADWDDFEELLDAALELKRDDVRRTPDLVAPFWLST